jgi:hypothetical protein
MSAVLSPITTADPLAAALEVYIEAKRREDQAKKQRIDAEEVILALAPAKEEGSQTIKVAGFKLTTTGAITYSCEDVQALITDARAANVPEQLVPVKTKIEFDVTGAKWLRKNDPDVWRVLAKHITTKAAKSSVKVSL